MVHETDLQGSWASGQVTEMLLLRQETQGEQVNHIPPIILVKYILSLRKTRPS